jgi:hypothetical protein
MSEYLLPLPESLLTAVREVSTQQGISMEQFLLSTITETVSAWQTREVSRADAVPYSALEVARHLNLAGPPDWSENIDK